MGSDSSIDDRFDERLQLRRDAVRRLSSVVRATRVILIPLVLWGLVSPTAYGDVQTVGNVIPARNPFDPVTFPGLPTFGNFINAGEEPNPNNPSAQNQTNFEGLTEVIVGQTSFGGVLIQNNVALRYQDLIIGDTGVVNGQTRFGSGTVRIEGFGSLYNNDPTILPFGLDYGSFGSKRDATVGFDVYVGREGNGTLEISGGGRAEIQDSVLVGYMPGSTGDLLVDGFDSFLGSGGFDGTSSITDPHHTLIGRLGIGSMTITNGGLVVSEAANSNVSNNGPLIAAVLGGDPFGTTPPDPGGNGTVRVNGTASRWIIGGSLQIGGFHDATDGFGPDADGNTVEYNSEAGRGTLYIEDGALVSIRPAIDADPTTDDLVLAIGRFGRVELSGGFLSIGNPGTRQDNTMLINDGVIKGSGRIETGVFRNRYRGEIRIDPGKTLVVDATSEFTGAGADEEPLANWGVIEVLGIADARAEIEFERAPDSPLDPIQPFRNKRIERPAAAPPTDFFGGLISAQHATLRFRSDIENTGMMAFTHGTNYVTGNVFNLDPDPAVADDEGVIFISGPDTTVVFENDLLSTGTLIVEEGADVDILARHSFVTAGELRYTLNPSNSSHITTAGDVGIAGKLAVTLTGFAPGSLSIGDTFEVISFGGQIGGVDLSDPLRPRPDLTKPPLFTQLQVSPNLTFFGLPASAVMLPIYTPTSVLLSILSIGSAMGPDFDGNGMVDLADLAIWKANKGITMGASVLQGDADGDGDVDGQDFLIWQANLGPFPGSGGGAGASPTAGVPEPTGFALLVSGGLLALAFRRRRKL